MAFESFINFFVQNKFVVLFYAALFLLVFINRKKFEFHLKVIALYKTTWGIPLMGRIASRHRELIKLLGYIGIGICFLGMAVIVALIFRSLFVFFTVPDAPAAVAPILPGVHVPGTPSEFFIPLIPGLIAIFIVAVIHEFSHGVVARAHNITVKSSGPAIIGPFFAAFVEPDEAQVKKMPDVVQYSVFAAGAFSNMLTALVVVLLLSFVVMPSVGFFYKPAGVSFSSIAEGAPADVAGLGESVVYTAVNNRTVRNTADAVAALGSMKVNETVVIGNSASSYSVIPVQHPQDSSRAYIGVSMVNRFSNDASAGYRAVSWLVSLFSLIGSLSLAIGLANLLPIGPLDGGKMLQLALHRIRGEKKGNKTLVKISLIFLLILLILLSPIFRETFSTLVNAF